MDLSARHAQALEDQIRHGWHTRAPHHVPGGERRGVPRAAFEQLARQDRIRLRALCAGLRALRILAAHGIPGAPWHETGARPWLRVGLDRVQLISRR